MIDRIKEFGRIDAESDLQLRQFFIRTDAYRRIEDQERIVVIGRKGTGKTAINRALLTRSTRSAQVHAIGLQFKNYPWGAHSDVKDESAAPVERYTAAWEFLMLVELAKLALLSPRWIPAGQDAAVAARYLARFIRANWGQIHFEFKDTFTQRTYTFDFEPKFAGASLGTLRVDEVPRTQLAGFLVEANRWLRFCLSHVLSAGGSYFVLFDDLDTGYDPKSREYSDRLIGLLLAARAVYQWGEELGLRVGPVTFLRSDIYDELNFPDKNKITRNLVETLTWTDEPDGENSLKSLMDQRIWVILGEHAPSRGGQSSVLDPRPEPWRMVFDDKLMRGTQPKYKHMAARTYLRPRDMIQFGNCCLAKAKAVGAKRIENRHIAAARPDYSAYLVDELEDEVAQVAPDWGRLLDALRRIHTMRFERHAFEGTYRALGLDRYFSSTDEALELLYRFSIIGFTKTGGSGYGGSAVAFRYRDTRVSFDPGAKMLQVHPGLKEALDLIESGER